MDNIGMYGLAFLLGTAKFLFAASVMNTTSLTTLEIALSTGLGALFSFNVFYWSGSYFMKKAHEKRLEAIQNGTFKKKNAFTKVNKFMVKTKMSKSGFWLICLFGPLLLSIPPGTIVVAKFYRNKPLTYPVAMGALCVWAFVLAYLNGAIFALFR